VVTLSHHVESCQEPGCLECRNKRPFNLPAELIEALTARNLVVFAGAGVSTEAMGVFKETLYQDVAYELGLRDADLSFSELMSRFCARPNGRAQLLLKIRKRLDYLKSFPEVYRKATQFHTELATVPFIQEIFTTNWDDLFEQECGATPIVTAEDFVFWNIPGRKVYKLHGSINNYGSLVATNEDYECCYEQLQSGLVGSQLKLALATKTVLFVGYSLNDNDFRRIYDLVKQEMGDLIPHAYIVTLDEGSVERYEALGLTPIFTDATFFLSALKEHLVAEELMLSDEWQLDAFEALQKVRIEHDKLHSRFDSLKNPEVIYAASYQDGLKHAFEHLLSMADTGKYSSPCGASHSIEAYEDVRKEKLRGKAYADVAYIDGYMNGLIYPLVPDEARSAMPLYYVFGYKGDILTIEEYAEVVVDAEHLHKTAYKHATKLIRSMLPANAEGIVFHHVPFL
jgi:NAD-dependent SIR2 family protein deacetylase